MKIMKKGNITTIILVIAVLMFSLVTIINTKRSFQTSSLAQKQLNTISTIKNLAPKPEIIPNEPQTNSTNTSSITALPAEEPIKPIKGSSSGSNPFGLIEIPKEEAKPPTDEEILKITILNCKIGLNSQSWPKSKPLILQITTDQNIKFIVPELSVDELISASSPLSLSFEPQRNDLIFKVICNHNELLQKIEIR